MKELIATLSLAATAALAAPTYRSPMDVACSPDGAMLAAADYTAGKLVVLDGAGKVVTKEIALNGQPAALVWSAGGKSVFVSERGAGTVAQVDAVGGKVTRRFRVGRYPVGIAASGTRLVVANNGLSSASIIDLAKGSEIVRVADVHRPWGVALTPDGKTALVGGLLPAGDARDATMACVISLIDVAGGKKTGIIKLPPGSINLRNLAVSPDGKWAYAVHSVGRFTLPTTQLERGWVMNHAMSIIDLATKKHRATVLLDYLMEGGADPWDIRLSKDGGTAWISLAGIHQIARIDLGNLHKLLEGKGDAKIMARLPKVSIWHEIAKDQAKSENLVNDLAALYGAGLIKRMAVNAKGPRGIALALGGKALVATDYFGGNLLILDPTTLRETGRVKLAGQPAATSERAGEERFFDASLCFQHWLSCTSCHPDTRSDGLNWDLLNDGIGNPKNSKSLVLSHLTPPVMSTGVRPNMEAATQKGFMFIQFRVVEEKIMNRVRSYLKSVRPEPSPYLASGNGKAMDCTACHVKGMAGKKQPADHRSISGTLSDAAKRGMALFYDPKTECAKCHPGPLFTDLKLYDVGTRHELDRRDKYDTPTLHELWRTAPYLHDGSAATLMDILTTQNKGDKHGKTSHLSEAERKALVEFLRSL